MVIKEKRLDINRDGYPDRIIAECHQNDDGSTVCTANQVEMRLSDGRFISVFKDAASSEMAEGKNVVYSPQFFYDILAAGSSSPLEPGRVVGKYEEGTRMYTKEELIDLCNEREAEDEASRLECLNQVAECSKESVEDETGCHIYQPGRGFVPPEGYILIGEMNSVSREHAYSSEALAVSAEMLYSPFKIREDRENYKLRENVMIDVKSGQSRNIAEYFYAYNEGVIDDNLLADALDRLWSTFQIRALIKAVPKSLNEKGELEDTRILIERLAARRSEYKILRSLGDITAEYARQIKELVTTLNGDGREEALNSVREGKSRNVAEYFYAYIEGEIGLVDLISRIKEPWSGVYFSRDRKTIPPDIFGDIEGGDDDWMGRLGMASNLLSRIAGKELQKAVEEGELRISFTILELGREMPDSIGGELRTARTVDMVQKGQLRHRTISSIYAEAQPADYLFWALGYLNDGKTKPLEDASLNHMVKLAKGVLEDKKNRPALILAFIDQMRKMPPEDFFEQYLPHLNMLLAWAEPSELPDAKTLIEVADNFVQLLPAVFVALAKKNDRSPEVIAWVKRRLEIPYSSETRAASTQVVRLLGDEAVPYLARLVNDENKTVRFHAYRALKAATEPTAEIVDIFKKGMEDDEADIRFAAALALLEWNLPEVAHILAERLRDYRKVQARRLSDYRIAVAVGEKNPITDVKEKAQDDYGLNVPVQLGEKDGDGEYPTLMKLALFAIYTFGQPMDITPVLEEMLFDEPRKEEMMLTAQAIIALKDKAGLNILYNRIESSRVHNELIIYASGEAVRLDALELAPRIFRGLFHEDNKVREAVAQNLHALGDERTLAAIIHHSCSENEKDRLYMAEALAYFRYADSIKRLTELTKDKSETDISPLLLVGVKP